MRLKYDIMDRPRGFVLFNLALQQMLAILAATVAVPMVVGHGLAPAAAMFGAGIGTIVYIVMTKRRSPMLLGSNFSFVGSMIAAFAGGFAFYELISRIPFLRWCVLGIKKEKKKTD